MSNSNLGRKALLNGNIQLAEHYFTKEESIQLEITQEIIENRIYFALYFKQLELANTLINQLQPSMETLKLQSYYHLFSGNVMAALKIANELNDESLLQLCQQLK